MSSPKETFIRWVTEASPETRLRIFQVVDTLVYYHQHHNTIVPLDSFQLPQDLLDGTSTINNYVSAIGGPYLPGDVQSLAYLRPNAMARLPLLLPKLPTASAGPPLAQMPLVRDLSRNYQYIQTEEHAVALWSEYTAANNKRGKTAGVPDAADFPSDPATQLAMVGELIDATIDLSQMIDKQTKSRRRDGNNQLVDSAQIRRIKAATNVEIELGCWRLFRALKNAQDSNIGILGWGGEEVIKFERFPSFRARFDAAKEVLKKSKASFDAMMQPVFMLRLAAAPNKEYGQKRMNMTGANAKAGILAAGAAALTTGHITKNPDGTVVDQGGKVIGLPRPRSYLEDEMEQEELAKPNKRRRTTGTTSSALASTQMLSTTAVAPQAMHPTGRSLQPRLPSPYNMPVLAPRPPQPRYNQQYQMDPSEFGGMGQVMGHQPQRRVYSRQPITNPDLAYGPASRTYNRQPNDMLPGQVRGQSSVSEATQAHAHTQRSFVPQGYDQFSIPQHTQAPAQSSFVQQGFPLSDVYQPGGGSVHQAQQVDPQLQSYDDGPGYVGEEDTFEGLFRLRQYVNQNQNTDDDDN